MRPSPTNPRGRARSGFGVSCEPNSSAIAIRSCIARASAACRNKTQVFLAAEGDHFPHRLTHTLEVAQIARTIAPALGLNEDLAEAISLGQTWGTPRSAIRARPPGRMPARHRGIDAPLR